MKQQLEFFQWTRTNILHLLDQLTEGQLNQIPPGHNNNIIWHAGHVHFAQQYLVYHLSGLPMDLPDGFLDKYVSGSRPESHVNSEEINSIGSLLQKYKNRMSEDFSQGKFKNYLGFKDRYFNVEYEFTDWESSFGYNNIHEAAHLGYMRAMAITIQGVAP